MKGKGEGGNTAKKVVGGAGLGALIGGIAGEEKERASAQPQVALLEPRSRVPRRANNYKSPAKLYSNSAFSNPCHCLSQASRVRLRLCAMRREKRPAAHHRFLCHTALLLIAVTESA